MDYQKGGGHLGTFQTYNNNKKECSTMNNNMLSVSFDKKINHHTYKPENRIYLRVYTDMFTTGLVAQMGIQKFATLMAIVSYMDGDGECRIPSQRQLAEQMGVHRNSVSKYVKELLDFNVDGKYIITHEVVFTDFVDIDSFYKIHL
jgi:Helix-turn-helix domain